MQALSVSGIRAFAAAASVLAALVAMPSLPAHGAPPKAAKHGKKPAKHKADKKKTVAQKKKPPPPPPLDGTSYDYDYDGKADGHPERRWLARVFVHRKAAALSGQALPVLVFLHGLNGEKIKHRWMGGGQEGDIRRIASEMMEAGSIPPILVAAPSSIDPNTIANAGSAWPSFDLDLFLDRTIERLGSAATLDRGRVLVAGHSGGGCNIRGGLASALRAPGTPVLAGFSIDTCMLLDLAKDLAHTRPTTHVVVSWQSISWPEREFTGFSNHFKREVKKSPPAPGVLRELDYEQPNVPGVHDAMVPITLRKYLPRILGPGEPPAPPAADAGAPAATDAGAPTTGDAG
ncbi:Hypothetical protein A7982_10233 [Minicystis rosea]|nr:Hypothetical protein A7982_10233 [Minicystis rosea]